MSKPDGGSPSDEPEIIESTAEPVEKLRAYEGEAIDPEVSEFASLVADRINSDSIVPTGFLMASTLLLYDLKTGVDGFSGEPIQSSLVGNAGAEGKIQRSLPKLARAAFSGAFADQVENRMQEMGMIQPEAAGDLDEDEIITQPVATIDAAQEKIIADARERIADLDWQHFGIGIDEVYKLFEAAYPLCLRQAPYSLPLNVLVDEPGKESGLLLEIPENHKKHLVKKYWIALVTGEIPPHFATFTRDHLLLKVPEVIVGMNNLDLSQTLMHLAGEKSPERGPMGRAATRMQNFMQEHPEIFKEQ